MTNGDKKIKGWRDLEKLWSGKKIKVYTKMLDNSHAVLYEGMFIAKFDRYILLTMVKAYKYNIFTKEATELGSYNVLLIKDDVISHIEAQTLF